MLRGWPCGERGGSIIKTMYETGLNLSTNYKETSLAGLAVNVLTC